MALAITSFNDTSHLPVLRIIGHRGAAGLLPENTLPGFALALDLGCPWLELDVHCLRDATLAVIHDATLARTTNRKGLVGELRHADLHKIDAGQGAAIPTLDEVFALAARHAQTTGASETGINIELKGAATGAATATFLRERQPTGLQVQVSSFDLDELRSFRAADPQTSLALLLHRWRADWLELARGLDASAVNLNSRIAQEGRIKAIRAAGYAVNVYTVNSVRRARTLALRGVQGIFTDRPDLMLNAFRPDLRAG